MKKLVLVALAALSLAACTPREERIATGAGLGAAGGALIGGLAAGSAGGALAGAAAWSPSARSRRSGRASRRSRRRAGRSRDWRRGRGDHRRRDAAQDHQEVLVECSGQQGLQILSEQLIGLPARSIVA